MRKLSFEENLRHRLRSARRSGPRFRLHGEKGGAEGALFLAIGAAAGLAAGVIIAQKYGGFSALTARIRSRFSSDGKEDDGHRHYHGDAYHDEEEQALSPMEQLEERVLETYHNDPVLSLQAIDIGVIDDGIVELTGWVRSTDEAEHAVTVARGTPGVSTVVNRLIVRSADGQAPLRERWKGVDDAYPNDSVEGGSPPTPYKSESEPPRGD